MMLPSEFPEVQARQHLKRLLAEHVDMQFIDLRTMLRLPAADLTGGCNLAAASFLLNVIAGSSVCFYRTSADVFKARGDRSDRFKDLLRDFYPWADEAIDKRAAIDILYYAARNPLVHSLGLDAPPLDAHVSREISLAKRALTVAEIGELEGNATRPAWARQTIVAGRAESGADTFAISVPTLYWGVHRMLHSLFADPGHASEADAVAERFGPLWDKYKAVGDSVSMTDSDGVRAEIVGPRDATGGTAEPRAC